MFAFVLFILWFVAAGATLLWGLEYYVLPLEERAFSPLADAFAPTGAVGHGLGVVGTAMILVGVVGYSARRRISFLRPLGALKHWLQVHIFLCTLGPFFILLHTTFKFGGLVSVAFWSMAVVVASGLFGRYVYVRIPKTLNGRFLGVAAVQERLRELGEAIRERAGPTAPEVAEILSSQEIRARPPGFARALLWAAREDVRTRAGVRRVKEVARAGRLPRDLQGPLLDLVRERARLSQHALLLQPFQRLFRYWHVIHLPLAVVMFLILAVHVAVAVLFGYTWVFS